jgi:hypothetical protein
MNSPVPPKKHAPVDEYTRLRAWLKTRIREIPDAVFELEYQLGMRGSDATLDDRILEIAAAGMDPEEIARDLVRAADDAVQESGRTVTGFVVKMQGQAFRFPFHITVHARRGESSSQGSMSGVPLTETIVGLSLEHTRDIMSLNMQSMRAILHTMTLENQDLRKRIAEYEHRLLESIAVYEDLINQKHVRDMELLKIRRDDERMQMLGKMLKPAIAQIANKFIGGKLLPEDTTSAFDVLRALFDEMPDDQYITLRDLMKEGPQREAFAKLNNLIREQREHPASNPAVLTNIAFKLMTEVLRPMDEAQYQALSPHLSTVQQTVFMELADQLLKEMDAKDAEEAKKAARTATASSEPSSPSPSPSPLPTAESVPGASVTA